GEVESRSADGLEHHGRQVTLKHVAREAAPAHLVQLEAWQRVVLAVALLGAAVDVVVAEAAEEEAGVGIGALAVGDSGSIAQPERCMEQGKSKTQVERATKLREGARVGVVRGEHQVAEDALLVVDRAARL